jgi:hypothetical protein
MYVLYTFYRYDNCFLGLITTIPDIRVSNQQKNIYNVSATLLALRDDRGQDRNVVFFIQSASRNNGATCKHSRTSDIPLL